MLRLCYTEEDEMLTEKEARNLASHWIQAWNSHDLDEIMSHYGEKWLRKFEQRHKWELWVY
jgi:hypothetical protein